MKYSLSLDEQFQYREAFASCAIEGNEYAEKVPALWGSDRKAFILECLRLKYTRDTNEEDSS